MSLTTVIQALATQFEAQLGTAVPYVQVTPVLNIDPTPPSIDVYPADDFAEGLGFGKGNIAYRLAVWGRVSSAANEEGQALLLSLMDPAAASSLAQAILSGRTLGGAVQSLTVTGPTGYGVFTDAGGVGSLLGAVWTVQVIP